MKLDPLNSKIITRGLISALPILLIMSTLVESDSKGIEYIIIYLVIIVAIYSVLYGLFLLIKGSAYNKSKEQSAVDKGGCLVYFVIVFLCALIIALKCYE
jgi:predicted permease